MPHILVVEPNPGYREQLCDLLERNGYTVDHTEQFPQAITRTVAAVVANAHLSGRPVTELPTDRSVPLILIADEASISAAVDAIREGAADYLPRSFDPGELLRALERTVSLDAEEAPQTPRYDTWLLRGACPAMRELFQNIETVAPTETTVLIEGEPGTGKELVARALHASGQRRHAPLMTLNCAGTPQSLIESELFGHGPANAPAAGLLQASDGGTLFLKEVGELPLSTQDRLIHFFRQSRTRDAHPPGVEGSTPARLPDVRVMASTHRSIDRLTENGQFREELFHQLNAVTLKVPPLRRRGEDIVELAGALLDRHAVSMNKSGLGFSDDALAAIAEYHWPGNLRELENAVERAVILSGDAVIGAELLAIDAGRLQEASRSDGDTAPGANDEDPEDHVSLEDYFVRFVTDNQDRFTETELAAKLGISRKNLWERRKRYSIPRRRTRTRRPRRDFG